jgi:hypothetical protein
MKKILVFILFFWYSPKLLGQSIVNTESMSVKTDSTFLFTSSLDGNYTTGNIQLTQLNIANQLAYKKGNNLIRLFFNYEYISENNETISSDYTSQLRYSYSFKKSSLYSFVQGQKAVSLSLNSRYLLGLGYRQTIYKKDINYLDVAFGPFYENEMYVTDNEATLHIINYRYSFSSFLNFKLSNKLQNNNVIYYQINSEDFKDYRVYFEPKLVYSFEHFKLYSTLRYRFHSTPYIEIKRTDTQILFGVNYELGFN